MEISMISNPKVGLVVIGRNLRSTLLQDLKYSDVTPFRVYVDSGSTDGSPELARSLEWPVIPLDPPYTPGKGRASGADYLLQLYEDLEYLQFMDGDCQLEPSWLKQGLDYLLRYDEIDVVYGLRRERYPNKNIFHRFVNWEWTLSVKGTQPSFGGDLLIRAESYRKSGGFRSDMIAGADIDYCVRLRKQGFQVKPLESAMTLHDIALDRWDQWWKRQIRGGYVYAETGWKHRDSALHLRECLSIWFWTLVLPMLLGLAGFLQALPAIYALQILRIFYRMRREKMSQADALSVALLCMVGKLPMMIGQMSFLGTLLSGSRREIIEYADSPGQEESAPPIGLPHI